MNFVSPQYNFKFRIRIKQQFSVFELFKIELEVLVCAIVKCTVIPCDRAN
jgi:hypothetical protein